MLFSSILATIFGWKEESARAQAAATLYPNQCNQHIKQHYPLVVYHSCGQMVHVQIYDILPIKKW